MGASAWVPSGNPSVPFLPSRGLCPAIFHSGRVQHLFIAELLVFDTEFLGGGHVGVGAPVPGGLGLLPTATSATSVRLRDCHTSSSSSFQLNGLEGKKTKSADSRISLPTSSFSSYVARFLIRWYINKNSPAYPPPPPPASTCCFKKLCFSLSGLRGSLDSLSGGGGAPSPHAPSPAHGAVQPLLTPSSWPLFCIFLGQLS